MLEHWYRPISFGVGAFTCAVLVACSGLPDARKVTTAVQPYKIDVVQGNVVTREQLAVLKPGMPRAVVRDVLGTPLLTSVFHAQRWDYVFTLQRQGAAAQSRRVTVFFKDDALERIEADDLPSESEFVSTLKSPQQKGPLPALEASEESLKKFPPAPKVAPVTPLPPVSAGTYPPLEPAAK
jgi:outer membrane protein assembly factor BamE